MKSAWSGCREEYERENARKSVQNEFQEKSGLENREDPARKGELPAAYPKKNALPIGKAFLIYKAAMN